MPGLIDIIARNRQPQDEEKRMELTAHLGELRTRIIRSIWYLIIGAVIAYQFFPFLYGILYKPLAQEMRRQNSERRTVVNTSVLVSAQIAGTQVSVEEYNKLQKDIQMLYENPPARPVMSIVFKNFHEPFMVRLKISFLYGFILVVPLIIWELSLFILPALTPQERRPLRMLVPLSVVLLALGIALAYTTMFYAMHWFLSYLDDYPQPAVLMQDPNDYILFFVKMMLAFGLCFQLPVVLMGLAFLGLVTSAGLKKNYRWGVLLAALAAVFIPTNDYLSMILISTSILILYVLSIFLVAFVEKVRLKSRPA